MSLLVAAGWCANACFTGRVLVQWAASERAGRSVSVPSFWWLSLAGAALFAVYTAARGELVLLAGNLLNAALYLRNIQLSRGSRSAGGNAPRWLLLAVVAALFFTVRPRADLHEKAVWFAVSVIGQGLWSSRFVVQWWLSEKRGVSHMPPAYWWMSLAGNTALFAYALHLLDPVLIAGLALGPIVQIRNLVLHARATRFVAT